MTNREIGTRLFVSPRTVQTHVSHILQKTGLRSRVEIARFAVAARSATWLMCRRSGALAPGMKTLTLILAFLPLIAFSLLARFLPHGYIGVAALAAAVIALIAILTSHPVWPPKILDTCSLVLFALIAVLGFTLGKATTGGWPPGAAPASASSSG